MYMYVQVYVPYSHKFQGIQHLWITQKSYFSELILSIYESEHVIGLQNEAFDGKTFTNIENSQKIAKVEPSKICEYTVLHIIYNQ